MVITLGNLPPHVTQENVSDLLKGDARIQKITFSNEGNPDKVIALIDIDIDRFEAQFISKKLNRTFFEDRRIEAYSPLFYGR
ncbi:hypothetical protein [Pontibacterium sp.]|uniref:hypothetical protein n=1 Tax=Pontibacterium sp. TaxID=2036026 RepID=UPI0035628B89